MDLASPAVSGTSVYVNGLIRTFVLSPSVLSIPIINTDSWNFTVNGYTQLTSSYLEGAKITSQIVHKFFPVSCIVLFNPLKPELNPVCYLLALLGAHHFLHVSRIRVKSLTFRRLMSYIYIWSTHS